jgi:hypothetical protein
MDAQTLVAALVVLGAVVYLVRHARRAAGRKAACQNCPSQQAPAGPRPLVRLDGLDRR